MEKIAQIARLSGGLYRVCTVLAYGLPAAGIAAIQRGWFGPGAVDSRFPALPAGLVVPALQARLVAGIAVLSVYSMGAAWLAMRRLFGRYRAAEILTDACAADRLRIGQALFAVAAMSGLVPAARLPVLSGNAPAGGG